MCLREGGRGKQENWWDDQMGETKHKKEQVRRLNEANKTEAHEGLKLGSSGEGMGVGYV